MDFDGAIRAHTEWKIKLSVYLRNPDQSLDPSKVVLDNQCPLGQWIHTEATQYSGSADYQNLRTEHAKFHRSAADVIRKADAGENVTEDVALGSHSEFGDASTHVVQAIMKMKAAV